MSGQAPVKKSIIWKKSGWIELADSKHVCIESLYQLIIDNIFRI